jgi:hypothetical protein
MRKNVTTFLGDDTMACARAFDALCLANNLSGSKLLKQCFLAYCEEMEIFKDGKWKKARIVKLEKKYGNKEVKGLKKIKFSDDAEGDE